MLRVFVFSLFVTQVIAGDHLDPFREPIRENEVRKNPTDPREAQDYAGVLTPERQQTRYRFIMADIGYVVSPDTGGPLHPLHQMQMAVEFGRRSLSLDSGYDFGMRFWAHLLSGQEAVYAGATAHWCSSLGLWGMYLGGGYRTAHERDSVVQKERFSPVVGAVYRWWERTRGPRSQWYLAPQVEMDFAASGVQVLFGLSAGQDWQW